MVCLGNEEITLSFLRLHPSTAFWTLLLTMMATPFLLRDSFFFFFFKIYLLFIGRGGSSSLLCGLSLVAASRGYASVWYGGFLLQLLFLWSTGFRAHGLQ